MTTFDRYLVRKFLHTYIILFVTFLGLYVVIDGFTNFDNFQEGGGGALGIVRRMGIYYAWQSSVMFDMLGATTAITAVMVVAGLLVKGNEYQPMLAAGVPLARLAWPFAAGLACVTAAVIANQEFIIPQAADKLEGARSAGLQAVLSSVTPTHDYATGILISGRTIDLDARRMKLAEFVLPVPELVGEPSTITAASARFVPETDSNPAGWVLTGASPAYHDLPLTAEGLAVVRPVTGTGEVFVASRMDLDLIVSHSRSASYTPTEDLVRRIRNPALSRQTARDTTLLLHRRLVQPLLTLLAGLCCIPLVIRRESRSLVASMALAAGVQGVLFGVLHGATLLGKVGLVGADVAAWLPVIATGTLGAWMTGYGQT